MERSSPGMAMLHEENIAPMDVRIVTLTIGMAASACPAATTNEATCP
jgi:hypothetical protein